ncbi:MAG: hypothetical protein ACXWLK_07310, partial [Rhizomicrobium sp.]
CRLLDQFLEALIFMARSLHQLGNSEDIQSFSKIDNSSGPPSSPARYHRVQGEEATWSVSVRECRFPPPQVH